jgi:chaperonin GroES
LQVPRTEFLLNLHRQKKNIRRHYHPRYGKEKPQRGEVVAISEIDEDGKKPVIKVGDVVLYGKYSGTEISFEGQDFLSMRESDIIAKF